MSGPKVFRIVTREEIIAICRRNLARLDAAVVGWMTACERCGSIDQSDIERVSARREQLRSLLDNDRFGDLQKQVPAEIFFLRADAERRIERAAAAEAKAKQDLRRTRNTARAVLNALDKGGRALPSELRSALQSSSVTALQTALTEAFALISANDGSTGPSERRTEIAARLGAGEQRLTFHEWLAKQPVEEHQTIVRIDSHLAELAALGSDANSFSARAAAIEQEPPGRQALLADSLLVDLATAVKRARERARTRSELRERSAELATMSSVHASALRQEIDDILTDRTSVGEAELLHMANVLIEIEVRAAAAASRRSAILQGLAGLGYEVSEGMATAWVEKGRVVLRKTANPGYGVELAGDSQNERLQVRTIAFGIPGSPRDAVRERDVETIWCDELDRLKTLLARSGGSLEIEKALPVGTPLKVVEDSLATGAVDDARTIRSRESQ
jgi:hypothetical protein